MIRFSYALFTFPTVVLAACSAADPAVKLRENFDDQNVYRVELRVSIAGKLTLSGTEKTPQTITLNGSSNLTYDERSLPHQDPTAKKVVRAYRKVEFQRTIGSQEQKAGIREAVRRMVVLRSDAGQKAPFSPDGPLTFGEIDVVKNDLFSPTLVPGLLPSQEVKPGDTWKATAAAIRDLTDLDQVESGELKVEFVGLVSVNKRQYAKLSISGSVTGVNEDGPNRQKLEGMAYFDRDADRLSYLKLSGTQEMLGPNGKVTGTIEGTFVMTREASPKAGELSDATLKGLELSPTDDNSLLLYDHPDLGVRFLHPRRWRVASVQGRQISMEEPKGGSILITLTPAGKTPTGPAFHTEVQQYLAKHKVKVSPIPDPKRVSDQPAIDRFGFDAQLEENQSRLEYAVVSTSDGGATVAARFAEKAAAELQPDLDRILKKFAITKKISEK